MIPQTSEKIWFVYLSDHHEGPFSLDEIKEKISVGLISPANYVWKEGMTDWRVMTEVQEFEKILGKGVIKAFEHTRPNLKLPNEVHKKDKDISGLHSMVLGKKRGTSKVSRFLAFGSLGILVLGTVSLYLSGLAHNALDPIFNDIENGFIGFTQKIPFVNQWVSPLPQLEDVSENDFQDLKNSASHDPKIPGPALSIALSTKNPNQPEFYVAANLPDQTQITLFLEGVSDTLINITAFQTQKNVTITKKLGKSSTFQVPVGQYRVYAFEAPKQPEETAQILSSLSPMGSKVSEFVPKNTKLFAQKSYFLGGTEDSAYRQQLRVFHEKLKAKALSEIQDLKQLIATFESQLNQAKISYETIAKLKKPKKQAAWKKFEASWIGLIKSLQKSFASKKTIEEKFYSVLFLKMKFLNEKMISVMEAYRNLIMAKGSSKPHEIKLLESLSTSQSVLNEIKSKINKAETMPPSPTGMPQKEGL